MNFDEVRKKLESIFPEMTKPRSGSSLRDRLKQN
jgi:hypothetical protein